MSHDPSRKHFLGKLIGLAAVAGLAPRALAKPVLASTEKPVAASSAKIAIRSDARTVARRADTI